MLAHTTSKPVTRSIICHLELCPEPSSAGFCSLHVCTNHCLMSASINQFAQIMVFGPSIVEFCILPQSLHECSTGLAAHQQQKSSRSPSLVGIEMAAPSKRHSLHVQQTKLLKTHRYHVFGSGNAHCDRTTTDGFLVIFMLPPMSVWSDIACSTSTSQSHRGICHQAHTTPAATRHFFEKINCDITFL